MEEEILDELDPPEPQLELKIDGPYVIYSNLDQVWSLYEIVSGLDNITRNEVDIDMSQCNLFVDFNEQSLMFTSDAILITENYYNTVCPVEFTIIDENGEEHTIEFEFLVVEVPDNEVDYAYEIGLKSDDPYIIYNDDDQEW